MSSNDYLKVYPNAKHLIYWITAREKARIEGRAEDHHIDHWRYCNVRRKDDRVTKFVHEWLMPHHEHEAVIPNTLMARLFNNPGTLDRIGYLDEWDASWVIKVTKAIEFNNERVFNPAYIVSTNGRKMNKVEYLCKEVLPPAFAHTTRLGNPELDVMWQNLMKLNGVGSFIAAQVVADLKHLPRWRAAPDWWTFVAPGPGSQRGMNRLRGLDANAQHYNQKSFIMYVQPLRAIIRGATGLDLCAQDIQNCLCEFDKYMRLITGEGRPKQTYKRATT